METKNKIEESGPSVEHLDAILDVTYTWGYEETREELRTLYKKACRNQWVSEDVLDWSVDVDLDKPIFLRNVPKRKKSNFTGK
jgi:hypothetical protein